MSETTDLENFSDYEAVERVRGGGPGADLPYAEVVPVAVIPADMARQQQETAVEEEA